MLLKKCEGVQLEKSSPTSPEDSFNRSMVTYETGGRERTFHVLYLRFFEDNMNEFIPFEADPLFTIGNRDVCLKDIVALCAIVQHPDYQQRKRLYVHKKETFVGLFSNVDFDELKNVFSVLESDGSYYFKSSITLLQQ